VNAIEAIDSNIDANIIPASDSNGGNDIPTSTSPPAKKDVATFLRNAGLGIGDMFLDLNDNTNNGSSTHEEDLGGSEKYFN
jgi:hypothetical protein